MSGPAYAVGDHVEAYLSVVDCWVRGVVREVRPTPGKEWGEAIYSIRYGADGSSIELHPENQMRPASVVDRLAELDKLDTRRKPGV